MYSILSGAIETMDVQEGQENLLPCNRAVTSKGIGVLQTGQGIFCSLNISILFYFSFAKLRHGHRLYCFGVYVNDIE
jgi:hypothetical protein